jgi:dienelactone hydrolase
VLILVVPALVFTLATFLLAMLWRLGLAVFRRPAPRYFRHTLAWHAGLFAVHLFVTVPILLGALIPRAVGTRPDERGYEGPRLAADGTWLLQTRESLAAERAGENDAAATPGATVIPAVTLTARDGVPLRAFLVPPRGNPAAETPRFAAILVHGLFRGALELETPGAMLRDLGGEVLLLELRNHGGSGKAPPTFGRDEALDVLAAVDFLRGRGEGRARPLVLYAVSLGTTAAALAAPRIPDLAGLVLDAPIDDLEATAPRWLARGGLAVAIRQPWASTILWSAQHIGGVPVDGVKPREALADLSPQVAVLFIGAGQDELVPPDSVRAFFDGLPTAPDRKELWIEPEASHGKVWVAAPDEYRQRLESFCERALEPETGRGLSRRRRPRDRLQPETILLPGSDPGSARPHEHVPTARVAASRDHSPLPSSDSPRAASSSARNPPSSSSLKPGENRRTRARMSVVSKYPPAQRAWTNPEGSKRPSSQ